MTTATAMHQEVSIIMPSPVLHATTIQRRFIPAVAKDDNQPSSSVFSSLVIGAPPQPQLEPLLWPTNPFHATRVANPTSPVLRAVNPEWPINPFHATSVVVTNEPTEASAPEANSQPEWTTLEDAPGAAERPQDRIPKRSHKKRPSNRQSKNKRAKKIYFKPMEQVPESFADVAGKKLIEMAEKIVKMSHEYMVTYIDVIENSEISLVSGKAKKKCNREMIDSAYLKTWIKENGSTPSMTQKRQLALSLGCSTKQIETWFTNSRRKKKTPVSPYEFSLSE
eukprot:gene2609-2996_t